MAKKTYVLDTSVYLTDSNCINSFGNNDIVIPLKVLEEIDKHKKRQDSVGLNARNIIRNLDEYYLSYPIKKSDKRKLRWIDAPLGRLKELQYNILYNIVYKFKPQKAILTNLSPVLDYKVLKKILPKNVIPAHDGLTIGL